MRHTCKKLALITIGSLKVAVQVTKRGVDLGHLLGCQPELKLINDDLSEVAKDTPFAVGHFPRLCAHSTYCPELYAISGRKGRTSVEAQALLQEWQDLFAWRRGSVADHEHAVLTDRGVAHVVGARHLAQPHPDLRLVP